jgi:lysophospholipase L1-like esterase
MKTIVCYGDSNTWGYKPEKTQPKVGFNRFSIDERWTGRLQKLLGSDYKIEEEGLNGRTTAFDDPFNANLNGVTFLECCLQTNSPLDLLIIALGTNDTKEYFSVNAFCIAKGLELLVQKAQTGQSGQKGKNPEILIIAPPHIRENINTSWLSGQFGNDSIEKSKALSGEYQKIAKKYRCHFLDMNGFAELSEADSIHLDAENHEKFALAVQEKIQEIFK